MQTSRYGPRRDRPRQRDATKVEKPPQRTDTNPPSLAVPLRSVAGSFRSRTSESSVQSIEHRSRKLGGQWKEVGTPWIAFIAREAGFRVREAWSGARKCRREVTETSPPEASKISRIASRQTSRLANAGVAWCCTSPRQWPIVGPAGVAERAGSAGAHVP